MKKKNWMKLTLLYTHSPFCVYVNPWKLIYYAEDPQDETSRIFYFSTLLLIYFSSTEGLYKPYRFMMLAIMTLPISCSLYLLINVIFLLSPLNLVPPCIYLILLVNLCIFFSVHFVLNMSWVYQHFPSLITSICVIEPHCSWC